VTRSLIGLEHVAARCISRIIGEDLARTSGQRVDSAISNNYTVFRIAGGDPVQLPGCRSGHVFGIYSITYRGSDLITVAIAASSEAQ